MYLEIKRVLQNKTNDLQDTTQKTTDLATRIPQNQVVNSDAPEG